MRLDIDDLGIFSRPLFKKFHTDAGSSDGRGLNWIIEITQDIEHSVIGA